MSTELLTGIVSSLGIAGVLVWFLYHTTTKTIPEKDAAHRSDIKDISQKFSDTVTTVTAKFSDTLREERVYRQQEVESLKSWIRNEASCRYNTDNKKSDSSKIV